MEDIYEGCADILDVLHTKKPTFSLIYIFSFIYRPIEKISPNISVEWAKFAVIVSKFHSFMLNL